jgi:hypothetical protein
MAALSSWQSEVMISSPVKISPIASKQSFAHPILALMGLSSDME